MAGLVHTVAPLIVLGTSFSVYNASHLQWPSLRPVLVSLNRFVRFSVASKIELRDEGCLWDNISNSSAAALHHSTPLGKYSLGLISVWDKHLGLHFSGVVGKKI